MKISQNKLYTDFIISDKTWQAWEFATWILDLREKEKKNRTKSARGKIWEINILKCWHITFGALPSRVLFVLCFIVCQKCSDSDFHKPKLLWFFTVQANQRQKVKSQKWGFKYCFITLKYCSHSPVGDLTRQNKLMLNSDRLFFTYDNVLLQIFWKHDLKLFKYSFLCGGQICFLI